MQIEVENGIIYDLRYEDLTATIVSSPNCQSIIHIPRAIRFQGFDFLITSVGKDAFKGNLNIDSISFDDDSEVRVIGNGAFGESSISKLSLPASLQDVKEDWCAFTPNLTQIEISVFNPYFSLVEDTYLIKNGNDFNGYKDSLLLVRRDIIDARIPENIAKIHHGAFHYCTNLHSVSFQSSNDTSNLIDDNDNSKEIENNSHLLVEIDDFAFDHCTNLENIDLIPASVTRIGKFAFYACHKLQNLLFSDNNSLEYIGKEAFYECWSIQNNIELPKSLKKIGKRSFYECKSIPSIDFSKCQCLTKIGSYAFYKCVSLSRITSYPASVTKIEEGTFVKCKNLETITFSANSQLESIAKGAFYESAIRSLELPDSLKSLEEGWSIGTEDLQVVKVSPLNKNFQYFDDTFLLGKINEESDDFDIILFARKDVSEASIPANIKKIASRSFYSCELLATITFDQKSLLEEIENYAFYNCANLATIDEIPASVTTIGEGAFFECENLHQILIPPDSQLKCIGQGAFYGTNLEELSLPASIENLEDGWISGSEFLTNFSISQSNPFYEYIDDKYLLRKDEENGNAIIFARRDITDIEIPPNIVQIGEEAFSYCQNLQSLIFMQPTENENHQFEEIGGYAFYNCSSLVKVSIPASTKRIGKYAFSACEKLQYLSFMPISNEAPSLQVIESFAFHNCKELIEIPPIPASIKEIGSNAFFGCQTITNITFDSDSQSLLDSIEEQAFACCYNLQRVERIPEISNEIGKEVFAYCSKLTIVEFLGEKIQIGVGCFKNCRSISSLLMPHAKSVYIEQNAFPNSNVGILLIVPNDTLVEGSSQNIQLEYI